jgi:hypothetical protein
MVSGQEDMIVDVALDLLKLKAHEEMPSGADHE